MARLPPLVRSLSSDHTIMLASDILPVFLAFVSPRRLARAGLLSMKRSGSCGRANTVCVSSSLRLLLRPKMASCPQATIVKIPHFYRGLRYPLERNEQPAARRPRRAAGGFITSRRRRETRGRGDEASGGPPGAPGGGLLAALENRTTRCGTTVGRYWVTAAARTVLMELPTVSSHVMMK